MQQITRYRISDSTRDNWMCRKSFHYLEIIKIRFVIFDLGNLKSDENKSSRISWSAR